MNAAVSNTSVVTRRRSEDTIGDNSDAGGSSDSAEVATEGEDAEEDVDEEVAGGVGELAIDESDGSGGVDTVVAGVDEDVAADDEDASLWQRVRKQRPEREKGVWRTEAS